jgi:membrane-anchored mycosin MYCP
VPSPACGRPRRGARLHATVGLVGCLAAGALLGALPGAPAAAAPCAVPSAPSGAIRGTPWPLQRLRPDLAWPLSQGDGVVVAVIDSGVSPAHPALEGKVLPGHDYLDPTTAGQCDEAAHGTIVAGVIGGRQPAGSAFHGVAPGAQILPVRVLRELGRSFDPTTPATVADAIRRATLAGAQVINLSLVTQPTPALADAVQFALSQNVVVVAAAGNEGAGGARDWPAYPAAYDGVIAVAGTDEQDRHVSTSTPGDFVDVAAPGVRVDGPLPQGGGYGQFLQGGTSFAAAYVSGVAALIRGYDPRLTPAQIADRITATADHPPEGWNRNVGFGVVNPYRAVGSVTGGRVATRRPGETVAKIPPRTDPLRGARVAAVWAAVGALSLTVLVLIAGAVIRRGKARRWRPGRPVWLTDGGPADDGDEIVAATARTIEVTGSPGRRAGTPPAGAVNHPRNATSRDIGVSRAGAAGRGSGAIAPPADAASPPTGATTPPATQPNAQPAIPPAGDAASHPTGPTTGASAPGRHLDR